MREIYLKTSESYYFVFAHHESKSPGDSGYEPKTGTVQRLKRSEKQLQIVNKCIDESFYEKSVNKSNF